MRSGEAENMYPSIEEMVKAVMGEHVSVIKSESLRGGDINNAYRLTLSCGEHIFVKTNSIGHADFFLTEAKGLLALQSAVMTGVPRILGMGIDEQRGVSFLALEYLESSPRISAYWETFGHQLANLHRAECLKFVTSENGNEKYGFLEDNYIGASPQKNSPKEKWTDFYRDCRILPQMTRAWRYFDASVRKKADRLLEHLDSYLREPRFPSLLHGDLWSGNILCGPDGRAWIIDPAVYVGDFETDLAMTQLFGSLPESFYEAYSEINPIDKEGYSERRKLYDLYHLLNHLNLFGGAYLGSVVGIIDWYA